MAAGKYNKIILFEYLGTGSLIRAFMYALLGYKVMYINSRPFLEKLCQRGNFEKIQKKGIEYDIEVESFRKAMDFAENIYDSRFNGCALIRIFKERLKNDAIEASYKVSLTEYLYNFFKTCLTVKNTYQKNNCGKMVFIPRYFSANARWVRSGGKSNGDWFEGCNVIVPVVGRIASHYYLFTEKLRWVLTFSLFPLWVFSRIKKVVLKDEIKEKYQAGFRIYKTDIGFHYKYRRIDYLLDGEKLNKENTLFCVETEISDEYKKGLEQRGYNFVYLRRMLDKVSLGFLKQVLIKDLFFFWTRCIFKFFSVPHFLVRTSVKNLYVYFFWKSFLRKYELNNYVVYNDFSEHHIIRNILLSEDGTKTFYYSHSCDYGDLFLPHGSQQDFRNHRYAHLYYDYFIVWAKSEILFKNQPNYIGEYVHIGCLWSEQAVSLSREKILQELGLADHSSFSREKKIIGVFDTDFGETVPLGFEDISLFIEGILGVLEEFPDTVVIFKEKYKRGHVTPRIVSYFEKLDAHPRCFLPGPQVESTEVISVSDLVISTCFTSTTIEALGARKKAIYFDAMERLRGTRYDTIPHFVAHGQDELKELTRRWLYDTTNEEFDNYLSGTIKPEMDIFADGKAITRFRELLTRRS